MNPKNWLTARTSYPAGGDPVWQEDSLAGQLLRDEFFGAAEPSNITGQLTATLAPATVEATGTLPAGAITGTLAATLAPATVSSASTLRITGTLSGTLGAAAASGAGGLLVAGTLSQTLAPASLLASGATTVEAIVGTASVTLEDSTLAATGIAPAPSNPYFGGGGTNADREWFEELERKEAAEKAAAEKAAQAETQQEAPRRAPSDALMVMATPAPAPLVRRGVAPAVAFARLADYITTWTAERDRLAAEEAERQAIAFAVEQQRIAEEAAALQLAMDDEAAEALIAYLMHA